VSMMIATAITGGTSAAIAEAAEQQNESVGTPSNHRASETPATANAPKPINNPDPKPAKKDQWTHAGTPLRVGDIQVNVTGAKKGTVAVRDMFGDERQSKDEHLSIQLSIENLSAAKKLDFSTWRGSDFNFARDYAILEDNHGNKYKRVTLGVEATPIGGVTRESIYPGKAVTDVLVFEKPVGAVEWLRLELPAKNFGGAGVLRFQIPSLMVQ